MFEQVLDLVGSVSATPGDRLSPAQLLDRITAAERAIAALRAAQARDLAAFSDRRVAADVAAKVPDQLVGRRRGGETTARNGQSLSRLSHRLKDHPAISSRIADNETDPPGPAGLAELRANAPTVLWVLPTGHTHLGHPPAALGPGARPDPQHWADQVDERQAHKDFVTACDRATGRIRGPQALASG